MKNRVIQYPPNTKKAEAIEGRFTLLVTCPHCQHVHHHPKIDVLKPYIPAKCGKGYYTIKVNKSNVFSR